MKKICQLCDKENLKSEILPAAVIRPQVTEVIKADFPNWDKNKFICRDHLNEYRKKYLVKLVSDERGEISTIEKDIVEKLTEYESISQNTEQEFSSRLTFGEKLSDKIATFGGSWKFIILFGAILLVWIMINTYLLTAKPFDPYPFILLNLILSCIAAIQAPIIMMSQNRQESRDRLRAENDYKINLKSELELRQLHQKVDHLVTQQWERMIEIQEMQMEMLEELKKAK